MMLCSNQDVNETPEVDDEPAAPAVQDLRTEVMNIWGITQIACRLRRIRTAKLEWVLPYAIENYSRKRRTPMDVPWMVEQWKQVVIKLCTAHDKKEIDEAEFKQDELMSPLLAAPVKDLRAFYKDLTKALRDDPQVPFFVWSVFTAWGKVVIDKCEDQPTRKRLRRKLANQVAELAEEGVKQDIVAALTGALMWRDPEELKEIKGDLEAGARPRLRGRESCLFLTTKRPGRNQTEHKVML